MSTVHEDDAWRTVGGGLDPALSDAPVPWVCDPAAADVFLFVYLHDTQAVGVFVPTREPLAVGSLLRLQLGTRAGEPVQLDGLVEWVNPWCPSGSSRNPGMGVRLVDPSPETRERVVALVHTIAYLPRLAAAD